MGSPTLQDVARKAGVSTATVSRCLNMPDRVGAETRERVLAVVSEMGYAPNFGARALAARRTNTIGAIIPTMENAIFARGLQAFQEELAAHGLTLLVASTGYRRDLEAEQVRTLLARGADALLLIGYDRDPAIHDLLAQRGVPVVVTWAYDSARETAAIGFDNFAAMRALAEEVLAEGHRRIAVISAPQADNDRARYRVAAIRAALATVAPEQTLKVVETPYAIESGAQAMRTLMTGDPAPTAVMCGNDVLAAGALLAAREMGFAVPQDVSVTGFDDIELARIVEPALTTVHVPHRAMGRDAARFIARMLSGNTDSAHGRRLETKVVRRGSLGPASAVMSHPPDRRPQPAARIDHARDARG